jgi:hypothetical protein
MTFMSYEPPTVKSGSCLGFNLPQIYPGVGGYAIRHGKEIWIPLVEGQGTGQVGQFLDALSSQCVLVNVCSPKLRGMLLRRCWTVSYTPEGVDLWRRKKSATGTKERKT